jgi:hypothetical protein
MVYRYYFLPPDDKEKEEPLIYCPKCKEDLTKPKSVTVVLAGDRPIKYLSYLDCGTLQDTPLLNILKNGKEEVTCTHCGASLADLDDVFEEEMVI